MCNSYAMGWADRTGRELYHCWCGAPRPEQRLFRFSTAKNVASDVIQTNPGDAQNKA
ncbi:hypothetical protein C4J93_0916 [Pseudomonas sp. R2-37-08W]|nr:hypothetical protein C4J93_0916 [Pseudomonas sp. R2-37-08W]